jgi:hypothetical protein
MTNYINIFFLSKGPSYIDVGVLNEKISQVNVTTKNLIFKLHLLLNTICCTRPLNPRASEVDLNTNYQFLQFILNPFANVKWIAKSK